MSVGVPQIDQLGGLSDVIGTKALGSVPRISQLNPLTFTLTPVYSQEEITTLLSSSQTPSIQALSALTPAADQLPYFTNVATAALTPITAAARTLLSQSSNASMLSTLGVDTALALLAPKASPTFTGAAAFRTASSVSFQQSNGNERVHVHADGERIELGSNVKLQWNAHLSNAGSADVGLIRTSAGNLKVTNGTTGLGSLAAASATIAGVSIAQGSNGVGWLGIGSIQTGNIVASGSGFFSTSLTAASYTTAGANSAEKFGASAASAGAFSTAIGSSASSGGYATTAVGYGANASGGNGAAFGSSATASGNNSTALGTSAVASHADSVALGTGATTTAINQVRIGTANQTVSVPGSLTAALGFTTVASANIGTWISAAGGKFAVDGSSGAVTTTGSLAAARGTFSTTAGNTLLVQGTTAGNVSLNLDAFSAGSDCVIRAMTNTVVRGRILQAGSTWYIDNGSSAGTQHLNVSGSLAAASLTTTGQVLVNTTDDGSGSLLQVGGSIASANFNISTRISPKADNARDLGTSSTRFKDGYFGGSLVAASGTYSQSATNTLTVTSTAAESQLHLNAASGQDSSIHFRRNSVTTARIAASGAVLFVNDGGSGACSLSVTGSLAAADLSAASGAFVVSTAGDTMARTLTLNRFALDTNNIRPLTDNARDLGTSALRFKDAYFGGSLIATNHDSGTPDTVNTNGVRLSTAGLYMRAGASGYHGTFTLSTDGYFGMSGTVNGFQSANFRTDVIKNTSNYTQMSFAAGRTLIGAPTDDSVTLLQVGGGIRATGGMTTAVSYDVSNVAQLHLTNGLRLASSLPITWSSAAHYAAPDTRVYRTGANALTIDNNAGGAASLNVLGSLLAASASFTSGATGIFTTADAKTVTVAGGVITGIA